MAGAHMRLPRRFTMTPRTVLTLLTLHAGIAIAAAAPLPEIPDHILSNIRRAVSTAQAGAVVTVNGTKGNTVKLHVEDTVMGTLPTDVEVPAKAFFPRDLAPGNRLLVFFTRLTKSTPLIATGNYELIQVDRIH